MLYHRFNVAPTVSPLNPVPIHAIFEYDFPLLVGVLSGTDIFSTIVYSDWGKESWHQSQTRLVVLGHEGKMIRPSRSLQEYTHD